MPQLTIDVPESITQRVLASLDMALAQDPKNMKLTDYWEHHKRLIHIKPLSEGRVQLTGESGFYFPGHSYSGLDRLNTYYKYLKSRSLKSAVGPDITTTMAKLSLPHGSGFYLGGRWVTYDLLRSIFHVHSILDAMDKAGIKMPSNPTFLEIGSGTGIQALVFSKLFPNLTYICLDLPETLSRASFFLGRAMPQRKLVLYKEWLQNDRKIETGSEQTILLPAYEAVNLPDHSIDMVINTDSLQEMSLETIAFYFKEIRRVLKNERLFYQSNRKSKKMGSEIIEVAKFPYTSADKHLFHRENTFMARQWIYKKRLGLFNVPYLSKRTHLHSLTQMA